MIYINFTSTLARPLYYTINNLYLFSKAFVNNLGICMAIHPEENITYQLTSSFQLSIKK
jgi:hypothetical protein